MTRNGSSRDLAGLVGIAAFVATLVFALTFLISGSWNRVGVVVVTTLLLFANRLADFSLDGRYLPKLSPPANLLSGSIRLLAFSYGMVLLFYAIFFLYGYGPGNLRFQIAFLVMGTLATSVRLIEFGATGRWWPVLFKTPKKGPGAVHP